MKEKRMEVTRRWTGFITRRMKFLPAVAGMTTCPFGLFLMFAGCSSFPPSSISAGFFGANVTVATPGWSAPVPVVESKVITKPTLLVPADSPVAKVAIATIQPTATLNATAVSVVVAPVAAPVLAVPAK
jgi:hypothetical protein